MYFTHYTRGIFIKSKRGREYVDYVDGSKKKKVGHTLFYCCTHMKKTKSEDGRDIIKFIINDKYVFTGGACKLQNFD